MTSPEDIKVEDVNFFSHLFTDDRASHDSPINSLNFISHLVFEFDSLMLAKLPTSKEIKMPFLPLGVIVLMGRIGILAYFSFTIDIVQAVCEF